MIEDLFKANKIAPQDYDLYCHYKVNELGRKLLDQGTMNTFMDEPLLKEMTGERLAYNEGRRSVFRDIHEAILRVEDQIRKSLNDDAI